MQIEETEPRADFPLAVKDIEFRAELIYFIVVDRFFDGDPGNNPGPDPSLSDPSHSDWGKYWGGDLQGIVDKLDYLAELGVTAVWVTPLFEQVEVMVWDSAPIHGYWTRDFKRIHARWVKSEDEVRVFTRNDTVFDELVAGLHERGMKLILDVVANHSSPDANGVKGQLFDDGVLIADFHDDKKNWYHHYGPVKDWSSEWQVQNCELAGLATFNENNTEYRAYVKSAMKAWLDKGVDSLRIDTVKHMPIWFWQEFTADMASHKPGVFMFGEWSAASPDVDASVEFANKSGMTILDFGLCYAIRAALGSNAEQGFQIVHDVFEKDPKYRSASELVTFVDNHDMPRFQSLNGDGDVLRMAIALVLTCRGIPCLFYGTEQYLHDDTNGGADPYNRPMMERFDTSSPLFQDVRKLSEMRRRNVAIQFGSQWTRYITPDVFCFSRRYRDARAFVALNRGEAMTIERLETDMADGEYECILTGRKVKVEGNGISGFALGRHEVVVLESIDGAPSAPATIRAQLNHCPTAPGEIVAILGDAPELGAWDPSRAPRLEWINANLWQMDVPFRDTIGQPVAYKYVILNEADGSVVPRREGRTVRRRAVPTEGVAKWRDVWEE